MASTGKQAKFADQVRRCIDECGMSRHAIAGAADVDDATISRFMCHVGNAGLSMDVLNRIAAVIGMRAVLDGEGKKGRL